MEVDAQGLNRALADLAETTTQDAGIKCRFTAEQSVRVEDSETATHLYRIVQEAVTNALKHAHSQQVTIALEREDGQIVLSVRDDGKGISSKTRKVQGMGLKSMQYRAALIGATLSVAPNKQGGTLVTCRLVENRDHGKKNRKPK